MESEVVSTGQTEKLGFRLEFLKIRAQKDPTLKGQEILFYECTDFFFISDFPKYLGDPQKTKEIQPKSTFSKV